MFDRKNHLYPFERQILNAVASMLRGEAAERLQRQIGFVNTAYRVAYGATSETNLFHKDNGATTDFPSDICFPYAPSEAHFATVVAARTGTSDRTKVKIWLVQGRLFEMQFAPQPRRAFRGVRLRDLDLVVTEVKIHFDPMIGPAFAASPTAERPSSPLLKDSVQAALDRERASGTVLKRKRGADDAALRALELRTGLPLSPEVVGLLRHTAGFEVDGLHVDFTGAGTFSAEAISPRAVPLAQDGAGNFWLCDVHSDSTWGAVLFVSHDPPVTLVQAESVTEFVEQALAFEHAPDWARLPDAAVTEVWARNPYTVPREELLASNDKTLQSFAEAQQGGALIADLRDDPRGKGLVTEDPYGVERCDDLLLFATAPPRPGLLKRLLSS